MAASPGDPVPEVPDDELVRRVAAGEPAAARTVAVRHLDRVVGLAARMLGDRTEAEDVAQESFLRFWREAPAWRTGTPVGPWLYRVAHNLCVDRLRRRRFQGDPPSPDLPDAGPGPLQQVQQGQAAAVIRGELDRLPERQRTAITLVHQLDLGNIAAADIMGVSVDALESLLARGRRTLRKRLSDRRIDLMGEPG